jgi:uncharacterized protein with NRDE domain
MCLILFSCAAHRFFPLVIAANRDEHHARASTAAAFWPDLPHIYAGRDLEKGGTWMGISTRGRFSAITNFREGRAGPAAPRSRGEIVSGFLADDAPAGPYLDKLAADAAEYNPFSVIAGDVDGLHVWSNRGPSAPQPITAGVHGLSNHLLDTPWPKVSAGVAALSATLDERDADCIAGAMFAFLASRKAVSDGALPDTGVGLQRERELSPPFIAGEHYGTRTSTLLLVGRDGTVIFHEKRYGSGGVQTGEDLRAFRLDSAITA